MYLLEPNVGGGGRTVKTGLIFLFLFHGIDFLYSKQQLLILLPRKCLRSLYRCILNSRFRTLKNKKQILKIRFKKSKFGNIKLKKTTYTQSPTAGRNCRSWTSSGECEIQVWTQTWRNKNRRGQCKYSWESGCWWGRSASSHLKCIATTADKISKTT